MTWHEGAAVTWHEGAAATRHEETAATGHEGAAATGHEGAAVTWHEGAAATGHEETAAIGHEGAVVMGVWSKAAEPDEGKQVVYWRNHYFYIHSSIPPAPNPPLSFYSPPNRPRSFIQRRLILGRFIRIVSRSSMYVVLFSFHFIKWATTLYCHVRTKCTIFVHSFIHSPHTKRSTLCKRIHSFPDNVLSAAYVRTYVTTYTYVRMYKSELHTYVHTYVHTLPTTSDLMYVLLTIATLHGEHQVRLEVGKWRVAVLWLPWQQTHTKPNQLFNKH